MSSISWLTNYKRSVEMLLSRHEVRSCPAGGVCLTNIKEPTVTKGQIDDLVKGLDRLGMGTSSREAVHKLQSTRSDALLASANSVSLFNLRLNHLQCPGANQGQAPGRI